MSQQTHTSSGKPLRDFNAYMAEKMSSYEPLEKEEAGQERLSPEFIKAAFSQKKINFADRTPEQERKAFDAFFQLKDIANQKNTQSNYEVLKRNPDYATRSDKDMATLAAMRTLIQDGAINKNFSKEAQQAMLEKFDAVYASPKALMETMDNIEAKPKDVVRSRDNDQGLTH